MKKNIIIFSAIDWDTQWQWQQELAVFLSKKYNVLFVENTGVRKPQIKDAKRIFSRFKNILRYLFGFRKINKNLFVLSPFSIPLPYNKMVLKINFFLIFNKLQKWLIANKFTIHSIFSFSATPLIIEILKNLKSEQINFLYTDLMSGSSPDAKKLKSFEKLMISNSDNVFYSSNDLFKRVKKLNKSYFFFPGGVDIKKFKKPKTENIKLKSKFLNLKKPIIGFLGQIKNVIDVDLIKKITKKFKNCSLVLVGPIDSDMKNLKNISENIILLGKQNHKDIPFILNQFKVGIIPYVKNSFTNSINPAKLNEYIASNDSVVSTNLNEVVNYNKNNENIVLVSKNHNEFLNNISISLKKNKQNYKSISRKYDWKIIFENLLEQCGLNQINKNKKEFGINLDKRINFLNKFFYISLRRFLFTFIFLYFFIFYSGFPSIFLNNLTYYDEIKNQNIKGFFVMTGHGDPSYYNEKYLDRLEEIKKYYQKFKPEKILIIGRWSNKQEDKVIKGLLSNEGINVGKIFVPDKYFGNTKENIAYSRFYFNNQNIENVLVITDYMHSNRVNLIKRKILKKPENYFIAKNLDNEKYKTYKFNYSLNELRVIIYESLAMIYAKLRSWI